MKIVITEREHWQAIHEWLTRRRIHATLDKLETGEIKALTFSEAEAKDENGMPVNPYLP